jgi:hypothetical protein
MKTEETMKAVKELGKDVTAWESRVLQLQIESESLVRKNKEVKTEIESALALAQQELDKKREKASIETQKVQELNVKLDADRLQFQVLLEKFNKEKAEFERDRAKMLDMIEDARRMRENVVNFTTFVKRESEKL